MKQKNTLSETYTLMNGINIPKIGLGTWFIPDDEAAAAVCKAVEIGYRHIDTAQAYENERGIGKGVRDCGIRVMAVILASSEWVRLPLAVVDKLSPLA